MKKWRWRRRPVSNQAPILIAVCGLHMRGYPLEKQMLEHGAKFLCEAETAPLYRLVKLPSTPAKPGLIRTHDGGAAISIEVWKMPAENFGRFVASIPSPLGIGKIKLSNGEEICGFVCEAFAAKGAQDITFSGGWRKMYPL